MSGLNLNIFVGLEGSVWWFQIQAYDGLKQTFAEVIRELTVNQAGISLFFWHWELHVISVNNITIPLSNR